jgi:hypothetical protein
MTIHERRIGGQTVWPVGLGCMNITHAYGPPMDEDAACHLLQRALDLGCNFLDTATIYGAGRSEELIARAIGHRRQDYFLASKCVLGMKEGRRVLDGRPEAIRAACEASLKRLETDVIDLYYLHRPDPAVPVEESVGALADLVREGKIRFIGLSEMGEAQLRRAHSVHPVAAMQSEYSLWVRNPEIAVLEACAELGTALVAFSPVGRGFLADPPADPARFHQSDMRRSHFPRFLPEFYPANLALLEMARQMAAETGITLAQLALAWTLAKGGHVIPIPGTTSLSHLEENHRAGAIQLDPEQVARLDTHFDPRRVAGPRYTRPGQDTVTTEIFPFEVLADGR